uniref:Uncharacterized protein n=1 Tax=Borrelia garinii subsp. bavariensis (strain ATCC BAA-2496 / DSM 23469 / PBi) TaxID=290434 RepID=A0A7I6GXZ1_BORGP|nr:hypothetical protein BGP282 [Borreliella bavariensis PBi]
MLKIQTLKVFEKSVIAIFKQIKILLLMTIQCCFSIQLNDCLLTLILEIMKIPKFLKDTEIQKFIRTEIKYAQKLLNELKALNSNFISIDAKENIKSRYIAIWISQVLSIFYAKTQTLQSIRSNINSVIFALRHIGTDELFRLIFKSFVNVHIFKFYYT